MLGPEESQPKKKYAPTSNYQAFGEFNEEKKQVNHEEGWGDSPGGMKKKMSYKAPKQANTGDK